MAVELTEEQKKSPYYKYYEREIKEVPAELMKRIMTEKFDDTEALLFVDKNKLFEDGYLPGEFGVFHLPSGGYEVANCTQMPGVTPEMFDWWFAWHGLDPMRYIIWNKDEHYYCKTRNPEIALNEKLSMKERYWHTTHDVKESMLKDAPVVDLILNFLPPEEMGFDPEKLKAFQGTIVCTPGMVHFLRPTEHGSELRTRFWFEDSKVPFDEMAARALLAHNVKEYTHLAEILPELYAEFKNKFLFRES